MLQPPSPPAPPRPELPAQLPLSRWSDSDVDALLTFKQFRPEPTDLYVTYIAATEDAAGEADVRRRLTGSAAVLATAFPHLTFYNDRIWQQQRQWIETGRRTDVGMLPERERVDRARRVEAGQQAEFPVLIRPLFPGAKGRSHPDLKMDTYWVVSLPIYEREVDNLYGDRLSTLVDIGFNLQAYGNFARVAPRLPLEIALQSSFNYFTRGDCVADGEEPDGTEPIEGGAGWVRERLNVPALTEASGTGVRIAHLDVGWGIHPELNFDDPDDTDANTSFDWAFEKDFSDGDDDAEVDPLDPGLIFAGHGISTGSQIISVPGDDLTGIAPGAQLIPIRAVNNVILDPLAGAPVAEAIWYATHEAGADVITMSIGGVGNPWMELAVADAVYNDVLVVAAAGNILPNVVSPAITPECIGAAGSTFEDQPWDQSARGEGVTIAAPATDVFSARFDLENDEAQVCRIPGDGGTSNSTAIISGVAALWLETFDKQALLAQLAEKDPEGTLQELFMQRLRATANEPAGWDPLFGAGIVDAGRLLDEEVEEMLDAFEREDWNTYERRAYLASNASGWGKNIDWAGLDLVAAATIQQNLQTVDAISRASAARGYTEASYQIDQVVGEFFATLASTAADLGEDVEEQVETIQEEAESAAEEAVETIAEIAEDIEDGAEELAEDGCEMVSTLLGMVGADPAADCS